MSKYYPPTFMEKNFNCLHCGVYAVQTWYQARVGTYYINYYYCECTHCTKSSLWKNETKKILDPHFTTNILPHEDMPDEIKSLYNEALSVVDLSPKAAAALLRLALQNLLPLIGATTGKIDKDIAQLVKDGLPEQVQQALDFCRVVGNNAVHPNELNLNDTPEMAHTMFEMLNFIVDEKIAKPKRISEMFNRLPDGAIKAIEKRDSK